VNLLERVLRHRVPPDASATTRGVHMMADDG
jgi:hypothetical protein